MAERKTAEHDVLDHNLRPWAWLNTSAQTQVLNSILGETYPVTFFPQMWERHPKITCKPGTVTVIPHRYYKFFTRDDSPIVGKEMTMNEAIEEFAPASISHGFEAGESKHEKKF